METINYKCFVSFDLIFTLFGLISYNSEYCYELVLNIKTLGLLEHYIVIYFNSYLMLMLALTSC